jgi:hypothetical protein
MNRGAKARVIFFLVKNPAADAGQAHHSREFASWGRREGSIFIDGVKKASLCLDAQN